jgi:two-component system response regulator DesR
LTLASEVQDRFPQIKVVILTTFARPGYLRRALDAGAKGYLLKDRPSAELPVAVRRVYRGLQVIDPELSAESGDSGLDPLSERERQILWRAGERRSALRRSLCTQLMLIKSKRSRFNSFI